MSKVVVSNMVFILQINNYVSEMQKMETRNSKNRDNYEKMKADVRLMTEELKNLQKSQPGKVLSL